MLDDDNGISAVRKLSENLHQLVYIRKMQSGGWLIQYINGFSRSSFAQFCGKFDTLRFSSG